jgi:hypothetical protein
MGMMISDDGDGDDVDVHSMIVMMVMINHVMRETYKLFTSDSI